MPEQPLWLERVPQMLDLLGRPDCPTLLDRQSVQELFGGLSARQANRIMQRCTGLRVGRSHLVDKGELRQFLAQYEISGAVEREAKRKQKIADQLRKARQEARAKEIHIPLPEPSEQGGLPAGVHRSGDQLRIQYEGGTDLLKKLYLLVQYISQTPEEFGL